MILLKVGFDSDNNDSLFSWILLLILVGIVIWRLAVIFNFSLIADSGGKYTKQVKRVKRKSPLEIFAINNGVTPSQIATNQFDSPFLATILHSFIAANMIPLVIGVVVIILGGYYFEKITIRMINAFLVFTGFYVLSNAIPVLIFLRRNPAGKDFLAGLYHYNNQSRLSLKHLKAAAKNSNDPYIPFLIADRLVKDENNTSGGSDSSVDYSEAIQWLDIAITNPKYNIAEFLTTNIQLRQKMKDFNGAYQDLIKYEELYGAKDKGYIRHTKLDLTQNLAEIEHIKGNNKQAIIYLEEALIPAEYWGTIKVRLLKEMSWYYFLLEDYDKSKRYIIESLHTFIKEDNKYQSIGTGINTEEFLESLALPFQVTVDRQGYLETLNKGFSSSKSKRLVERLKVLYAKQLRDFGMIYEADNAERDLVENHGITLFPKYGLDNPELAKKILNTEMEERMAYEPSTLFEMGYYTEGLEYINYLVKKHKNRKETDYSDLFMKMYERQWDYTSLIQICDDMIVEYPDQSFDLRKKLVTALYLKGRLNEAYNMMEDVLGMVNKNSNLKIYGAEYWFYWKLARANYRYHKAIEICKAYESILVNNPNSRELENIRYVIEQLERRQRIASS